MAKSLNIPTGYEQFINCLSLEVIKWPTEGNKPFPLIYIYFYINSPGQLLKNVLYRPFTLHRNLVD